jgi:hypothetical protein
MCTPHQLGPAPRRHAGAPADETLTPGGTGERHHHPLLGLPGLGDPVPFPVVVQALVHPIGHPQEGQLAQSREVAYPEVVAERGADLVGPVDVPVRHPASETLGGHVDQLDLVGRPHDVVRHPFALHHPGDLGHDVVERLKVLDVDRGDDVDPRRQKLIHVLPALGVATVGDVRVGQLVDEHDVGPAGQDGIEVHLLELLVSVIGDPTGDRLQVPYLRLGAGPAVGLDIADDHVLAPLTAPPAFVEHGEGLADARSGAEIDPQPAPGHRFSVWAPRATRRRS